VFFFSLLWNSFAAGPLDYFEVILGKETAKVWEALDITISAVDKNGEIITDYTGDILVFSESDAQAEFPNDLAENSYSFTAVNEWSVKFENAVKFKNVWIQDVYVYDLSDENILWVAEATITAEEVETNVEINILSPEKWVTLGKNNITISGSTKKNHQVRIIVNGEQDLFTTSNAEGIFEKEVENMQEWANTIIAQVLNSDNEKIGESELISIKINSNLPEFKRITVTPTGTVEAETQLTIEVVSNTWLSEVKIFMNDIITELEETKDWIYTWTTLAPSEAWEYPIDLLLKNEFANETDLKAVETISVTAKVELNAGPEETPKVVETIEEEVETELSLDIKNIQVTELKTKSVLTWDAPNDAESYNIYKKISDNEVELIENITETRYEIAITGDEIKYEDFAIKAVGKTGSGETVQWSLSEMTKVKTGPELYILLALITLILTSWIFFMRQNNA